MSRCKCRQRILVIPVALSLLIGEIDLARAYDADLHYGATFALSVALGFGWDRSLLIASADQSVDTNVYTKPTMHFGLGQAAAKEVRQFEALGGSIGLSLQDYYFHCFSPIADKRGERSAVVSKHLDELETRAKSLIDKRNESRSAEDETRALVAAGIYLHCQQDSWSHSGYGDHAFGHVLDDTLGRSPDETPRYPSITKQALHETINKLESFLASYSVTTDRASRAEIDELISGLTEEPSGVGKSLPVPSRTLCNQKITEYWLAKTINTHPALYDSQKLKSVSTDTIGPIVYQTKFDLQKGPPEMHVVYEKYLLNRECQELFAKVFPEIKAKRKFKVEAIHNIQTQTDWADPVSISFLMLPTQELPLLNVELSVSPVFNETSDYGRWHIDKK